AVVVLKLVDRRADAVVGEHLEREGARVLRRQLLLGERDLDPLMRARTWSPPLMCMSLAPRSTAVWIIASITGGTGEIRLGGAP
ncbi:MAG TPA: hypothetical protein VE913_24540, partial [Longimicrobium sp.]|nr:hypothetical protein [Longimicrobium sp.]